MSRMSRRLLASAPLLFALAGCDANQLTEPTTAPSEISPNYDYRWGNTSIRLVPTPGWPTIEVGTWQVIGPAGGRLRLGLHELVVPARVVANRTRFEMKMQYGANLIIDLTAIDQVTGAEVTQFRTPVQLKLSYWLLPVPRNQVNNLVVIWLKDDDIKGELVPVKTTTQPGDRYVVGWLTHFTKFAMGMN